MFNDMEIIGRKDAKTLGRTFYFTGKPCVRGHVSKRYVAAWNCFECVKENNKQLRTSDPEKYREYGKIRWKTNKDAIKNYKRQYYLDNSSKEKLRTQRFRDSNPDYNKNYYRGNREYFDQYRKNNRASRAAYQNKRRAHKLQATPLWAEASKIKLLYEGAEYLTRLTGIQWDVDHEIPLKHKLVSGLHVYANLQLLTHTDNVRKHNKFKV